MAENPGSPPTRERRRASRPAGPAKGEVVESATGIRVETPAPTKVRVSRPAGPPPRRKPHRALVAGIAAGVMAVVVGVVGAVVLILGAAQRDAEADQARQQRFVDTASQTVVNMFSYTQDNIDESVNNF